MDENNFDSKRQGYDTQTFGTIGGQQASPDGSSDGSSKQGAFWQSGRKEGTYQQDTAWKNGPSQGGYGDGRWNRAGGPNGPQGSQPGNGFGIASMVLGILSLVLFCTCINIPLAIISIVFAIIHINRKTGSIGFGIAGLITSVISVILTVIMIIFLATTNFGTEVWNYSQTLPFEQFIDGDDFNGPNDFIWDGDSDEPGEYMEHHGQEHIF